MCLKFEHFLSISVISRVNPLTVFERYFYFIYFIYFFLKVIIRDSGRLKRLTFVTYQYHFIKLCSKVHSVAYDFTLRAMRDNMTYTPPLNTVL